MEPREPWWEAVQRTPNLLQATFLTCTSPAKGPFYGPNRSFAFISAKTANDGYNTKWCKSPSTTAMIVQDARYSTRAVPVRVGGKRYSRADITEVPDESIMSID
ncbi:predicted protein [Pyrenophora tritici-repentis Pt-1C-BFP]|uniref:Uncharacterized protein n=1 Tax=Pyrenophora tritici-repentis (strain Pt-1C-BFP) TaxID=426418 RepID=B2WEY2_PYRTR|nr:uncharacterized protein PTRG_08143 [Pyrenophora tritici-repentis Pt-1C-BFP]EDU51062.1 predicted protein [Pyrenophora tritici-repentis Pt-1C-BFP]